MTMISNYFTNAMYNIFVNTNTKRTKPETKISRLMRTLGQPTRIRILLIIGEGEACVCHLEAILGLRQAYISQHLMALRKEKLLVTRREGRFIYYRLRDPAILELVYSVADLVGVSNSEEFLRFQDMKDQACECPQCEYELSPSSA